MNSEDIFIVHPTTPEQTNALKAFIKALKIKFETTSNKSSYNPDFIAKIKRSEDDFKNGRFSSVNANDLEKYIDNL